MLGPILDNVYEMIPNSFKVIGLKYSKSISLSLAWVSFSLKQFTACVTQPTLGTLYANKVIYKLSMHRPFSINLNELFVIFGSELRLSNVCFSPIIRILNCQAIIVTLYFVPPLNYRYISVKFCFHFVCQDIYKCFSQFV